MKKSLSASVGLPGATLVGLFVWALKVFRENPSKAVDPELLLHGVDEYWNGDYPEGERPW